jgi:hypothetical protein
MERQVPHASQKRQQKGKSTAVAERQKAAKLLQRQAGRRQHSP